VSSYDELELRATRLHPARQSSMYTLSRMDTSVVVVYDPVDGTNNQNQARKKSYVNQRMENGLGCNGNGAKAKAGCAPNAEAEDFS
jgi:tachykinin receptor 3